MVDVVKTPGPNVVDFAGYRAERRVAIVKAQTIRALCRHCGAALGEGESDDDCSSAGQSLAQPPRRMFRAD